MSDENQFLKHALLYAELGYSVMPCVPGEKRPATAHGVKDATTDDFQIESWWADNPNFNLAIAVPATVSVIDRDVNSETGKVNPDWPSSEDQNLDLMAGPVATTPRGGSHSWVRLPAGFTCKNVNGQLAKNVDVKTGGGYVLVYPSVIDGGQYSWLDTNQLDCSPDKLPIAPDWLLNELSGRKSPKTSTAPEAKTEGIPEGGRNSSLASYGGYLRRGGSSEAEILAALQVRNSERCTPPLPDSEVRQIARSIATYEPDQIQELLIEGCEPDPEPKTTDPGKFPSHLLNVPGFIHKVMDYNLRGASKPQPELALAGALSLLGALTGRKVEGQTRLRTNIYCVGMCDTGGGKDRSLQVNKKLLMAAELPKYIPMEDVASASGLVNATKKYLSMLLQVDEIGRFLRSAKDAKANPHLAEVQTVLLKFFSCANSFYAGKGFADVEKTQPIVNPHLVLYGVSVGQSVMESFTSESLDDGFIARLMIFEASNGNPAENLQATYDDPDQSIIDEIVWWDRYQPGPGNLSHLNTPTPRMLTEGPEVAAIFRSASADFQSRIDKNSRGSAMWTRAAEHARKLALLYQLSADRTSDQLTTEAAKWGVELIDFLVRKTLFLAADWIGDSRVENDSNAIVRKIRELGGKAAHTQIRRALKRLDNKSFQDRINDLISQGVLVEQIAKTSGRPSTVYALQS